MEIPETSQSPDLTLFAGRDQALTLIAGTCSATQAQYLKEVRESGAAAQAGLTWDDYCDQYVGRSRAQLGLPVYRWPAFRTDVLMGLLDRGADGDFSFVGRHVRFLKQSPSA